jgi:hypothetical protein
MSEVAANSDAMELRLRLWRPVRRGALRGFACVDLPCGLEIAEIMVVAGSSGLYARLPQRPRVRDGNHLKGQDGKPLWDAPIQWQSGRLANAFSAAVIAAVRQRAPEDLDELD